jgi:hypothetical protein
MLMNLEGLKPRKTVLAMPKNNCKLQTRPLVRKDAQNQQPYNCLKIIKERRRKIGRWPQMGALHQDSLAV